MRTLYMNLRGTEKRIAIEEGGRIAEFWIERPGQESLVGNIYAGRVMKVLPGMQAVFVDIGTEKHAYLHRDDIPAANGVPIQQLVHQGQALLVQVVKDAVDTKGPKLTGKIELTGRYAVYMPYDATVAVSKKIRSEEKRHELHSLGGTGVIFRSASGTASLDVVQAELEGLRAAFAGMKPERAPQLLRTPSTLWERVFQAIPVETVAAVITDEPGSVRELEALVGAGNVTYYREREDLFIKYGIGAELDKALKKIVWLEQGAYLLVEQTETLTVIDVNTGKFTGNQTQQDTVRKTNEWAAVEIARQLRLRDIGGMILIDFINMRKQEDQQAVRQLLITELQKDAATVRVLHFTGLGILEMTRKRKRKALHELLLAPAGPYGGYALAAETAAYQLERELLQYRGTDYEAVLIEAARDVQSIFQERLLDRHVPVEVHFVDSAVSPYQIRYWGTRQEVQSRKK